MDLEALEVRARSQLERATYDYFAGGADDELTLADNAAAWSRYKLRPRVLRDVSTVDTNTTVLGLGVGLPVLIAPAAYQKIAHEEGEVATAEAAARASTVMVVSTFATTSLETVARAADGPKWFQLYVHNDRALTSDLVDRAVAADYKAIVLTVDLPVVGNRRRDVVNNFTLPHTLEMANIGLKVPEVEGSGIAAYAHDAIDSGVTFDDLEWLRSLSDLPVVVKGIVRGDDAARAVQSGASAVIVSNHGGRQLDGVVATAEALPEIVDAVGSDAEVLVDGGVRRGTDVVRALALGARAVLIGRPILWGLVVGGAAGVSEVLSGFREELIRAMALCGTRSVDEITSDLVARP